MENKNQEKNIDCQANGTLRCEILCNDDICIPRERYDELIRAESDLRILRRAYQTKSCYYMEYIMDAMFDPTLKYTPDPAPTILADDTAKEGNDAK